LAAAVAFVLTTGAAELWAGAAVKLSETAIFIEINDTDGDAGLQVFLDGDAWKKIKVIAPNGEAILKIKGKGNVRVLGLTEQAFESEEPGFDELSLAEFLKLFPEGKYKFEGKTIDGMDVTGSATLTHDLPDAPVITDIDGDSDLDDGVDDVDPSDGVDISWDAVTTPEGIEIDRYQIIVECEDPLREFFMELLADSETDFTVTVPSEFFDDGAECKVEIIVVEVSGNKVISEVEFMTIEP
jgi:hypothetical protein